MDYTHSFRECQKIPPLDVENIDSVCPSRIRRILQTEYDEVVEYHYRKNPDTFWHPRIWQILSPVRSRYVRNYVFQACDNQLSDKLQDASHCISSTGSVNTFEPAWLSQSHEESLMESTACTSNTCGNNTDPALAENTADISIEEPKSVNSDDTVVKRKIR